MDYADVSPTAAEGDIQNIVERIMRESLLRKVDSQQRLSEKKRPRAPPQPCPAQSGEGPWTGNAGLPVKGGRRTKVRANLLPS